MNLVTSVARNNLIFALGVTLLMGLGACGGTKPAGLDASAGDVSSPPDSSKDLPTTDTTPGSFTVGGTITGLVGSGLVLQNNGAGDLALPASATTFTFVTPLATGAAYAVTILAQPTAPAQTCAVTAGTGSGVVAAANVVNVAIVCTTGTFTVGGTITGLTGSGLVLQDNVGDDLAIAAGATTFAFATPLGDASAYVVTVLAQPTTPSQVCTVDAGAGTVISANVTNIAITCVPKTFTVGGTISGLSGSGLVLQDSSGDNFDVAAGTTSFAFATPVASGTAFAVTVLAQPRGPTQTCTVTSGTGVVDAANVTTVTVACSVNTFTVGGTISGLTGSGLILQNNSGGNLAVAAGATSFVFATPLASGAPFAVTVLTQPATPVQNCTISGGSGVVGAANISSVVLNCAVDKFTIGGQLTGLRGTLVLRNGAESQSLTADGMFAFPTPISSGASYAVTVATQPVTPSQTCTVTNGTGQIGSANVTNISVTCTTNVFHVQASITGLTATGLVLRNGLENLLVHAASDVVVFPTAIASGSGYSVIAALQPTDPSQTCTVGANAAGLIAGSDVTVPVVCVTNSYNIRVTVTGLAGAGLVLHNGADSVPVTVSSTFNLPTKVLSGGTYQVTVTQQPAGPSQTCSVSPPGPATVGGADVQVFVSCGTNAYRVSGTITGLAGSGLILQNNLGNDLTVAAGATTFQFMAPLSSGGSYSVTVKTQPTSPWQTCTPSANTGPITNANITNVLLTCVTNPYSVIVSVTNLVGSGLVLQNNTVDNLPVSPPVGGAVTVPFGTKVLSGQPYAVTVLTPPSSPSQLCTVTPPTSGMIAGGDVTLAVACSAVDFSIGGTILGLVNAGLVLHNTTPEDLAVSAGSTTFTFGTNLPTGATYGVSVSASPTDQSCQVANDSGPVASANVTSVSVNCAICTTAQENQPLALACPPGQTIAAFDYANYGTTQGDCGALSIDTCSAPGSAAALAGCVGQNSCTVSADNTTFGDPCSGFFKYLTVQARCQ